MPRGAWLARAVVRYRIAVVISWIAATVGLAPLASRASRELDVAARVNGSEAASVDSAMAFHFGSPFAHNAIMVLRGAPSPDSGQERELLARLVASVSTLRGVTGTLSALNSADTLFTPASGSLVIVGLDPRAERLDILVSHLRRATAPLARELAVSFPGTSVRWTGSAPVNADIRQASAEQGRAAELRVLPLTIVLLVLAFGALVASMLPLVAGAAAIVTALGLAMLIHRAVPLSIALQNIVSMIGLGVGVDYALLCVSRFREAIAEGIAPRDAAVAAGQHAGGTIALSGVAVCIGFGALLLVPLNEIRSIGVGGILVVATSVLAAVTLLPALLALLGERVDLGRVMGGRSGRAATSAARWRAWGNLIVGRPALILVVASAPLVALALQARRLDATLPSGNWLPRGIESGVAMGDLIHMGRGGVVNGIRVLVELPPASSLYTSAGWNVVARMSERLRTDPRIARVQSITTLLGGDSLSLLAQSFVPDQVSRMLLTSDGQAAIIDAIPRGGVEFIDLAALVRVLRKDALAHVTPAGSRIRVGGLPAMNVDYEDAITLRAFGLVALVVGLTLAALMAGFRSLLVPLKAIALNLLSVASACGAVVVVFQDGHGARLFGLNGPSSGVFPAVPLLVFCIVFGLSMDYEVFLVSRVAEARRAGFGEHEAVVEGLTRTGGVITSAAAIMIAVFGAFAMGSFLFIKMLGLALAVAIFVDATFVRLAIGPALLVLAGRWNWWPGDEHAVAEFHAPKQLPIRPES